MRTTLVTASAGLGEAGFSGRLMSKFYSFGPSIFTTVKLQNRLRGCYET